MCCNVLALTCPYCCRALAQGLARNQGRFLGQAAEEQEAGESLACCLVPVMWLESWSGSCGSKGDGAWRAAST